MWIKAEKWKKRNQKLTVQKQRKPENKLLCQRLCLYATQSVCKWDETDLRGFCVHLPMCVWSGSRGRATTADAQCSASIVSLMSFTEHAQRICVGRLIVDSKNTNIYRISWFYLRYGCLLPSPCLPSCLPKAPSAETKRETWSLSCSFHSEVQNSV